MFLMINRLTTLFIVIKIASFSVSKGYVTSRDVIEKWKLETMIGRLETTNYDRYIAIINNGQHPLEITNDYLYNR